MIKKEMIAPCGLDCAICRRALQEDNPCMGCHGPDEGKSDAARSFACIRASAAVAARHMGTGQRSVVDSS
ncbi:MAG: hypothetical protein JW817_07360 [Clostridiales bacterium]|nr:hypothetical protein [Clostridiales bacterium]